MYEQFYKLREKPFAMLPDPDFINWSHGHSMAYTMLEYGVINNAGFKVITGEIGCRDHANPLPANPAATSRHRRPSVKHPREGRRVAPVDNDGVRPTVRAALQHGSLPGFLALSHRSVRATKANIPYCRLIVDEAQNLGTSTLEELRMLSNINADKDRLIQIILVGQPELRKLLESPTLVQFVHRISSDFHLAALDPVEVYDYVRHRGPEAAPICSRVRPAA